MNDFKTSQAIYRAWMREQPRPAITPPPHEPREPQPDRVRSRGMPCPAESRTLAAKALSAITILGSARVPLDVLEARNAHCAACVYSREGREGRRYCRCCGCPASSLSEVGNKNQYAANFCPGPHRAFGPWEEGRQRGMVSSVIHAGLEAAKSLI